MRFGSLVLIGAANYRAALRDTGTARSLREWNVGNKVPAVAQSRDGRCALTADEDWEEELHDEHSGRTMRKCRYDSWLKTVAFSSDGRRAFMEFGTVVTIICDIGILRQSRSYKRSNLMQDGGCS